MNFVLKPAAFIALGIAAAWSAPAAAARTSYTSYINANGTLGSTHTDATASKETQTGDYNVTFGNVTNTTFCTAMVIPTLGYYAYASTIVHNGNQVAVAFTSPAGLPTSLPFYILLTC
jgi:hypothetical protein